MGNGEHSFSVKNSLKNVMSDLSLTGITGYERYCLFFFFFTLNELITLLPEYDSQSTKHDLKKQPN